MISVMCCGDISPIINMCVCVCDLLETRCDRGTAAWLEPNAVRVPWRQTASAQQTQTETQTVSQSAAMWRHERHVKRCVNHATGDLVPRGAKTEKWKKNIKTTLTAAFSLSVVKSCTDSFHLASVSNWLNKRNITANSRNLHIMTETLHATAGISFLCKYAD